jgi:Mce-associated membrane protein
MSTTRHLINRQRRLATTAAAATATERGGGGETAAPAAAVTVEDAEAATETDAGAGDDGAARRDGGRHARPLVVLAVLTVLLGGFAAFAATRTADLRDVPAAHNTALTDIARTSEVKGQVTQAVEAVFSYNFADARALDLAVEKHLTGRAVEQHDEMLAAVRKEGPKQKLVLTTTVTAGGVELLDGDRARVLLYADQSNTRTATKEETTYAAAMLAVDAVHEDGTWRIAGIDTFGAGS